MVTNNTPSNRATANDSPNQRVPAPTSTPAMSETATAAGPPPYLETPSRHRSEERGKEEDEHEAECHPFWTSWSDMARGIGLIIGGILKIPFVIGNGLAKIFWYIPVLYGDATVWKWPDITGFPSACKASLDSLWYGIWNGLTDWLVLPYKGARKEGVAGFFKGFFRGLANLAFKPAAGGAGFIFHPFFGIYKEASKFKLTIKRDRHARRKLRSPV
ncbi:hypothetical protein SLS62_004809 [Diatrype stigma]|uniref:Uncharacterized protein n=1 Tax=Diatrype stigma TaxID=117547 RepID=A0AAN9YTF5_9PEZI